MWRQFRETSATATRGDLTKWRVNREGKREVRTIAAALETRKSVIERQARSPRSAATTRQSTCINEIGLLRQEEAKTGRH
jgi:hypothetical protein